MSVLFEACVFITGIALGIALEKWNASREPYR